jgi:hypothetical protein
VSTPSATPVEADFIEGTIDRIDRGKRSFRLNSGGVYKEFGYRDDTRFLIVSGVSVRLDEYLESWPNSLPISERQTVRVKWRASANNATLIATEVAPTKSKP